MEERGMALTRGRRTGRESLIGLVVLATALIVCLIAGPTSAAIAKQHGSGKLTLKSKPKTQSDQGLLAAGQVKVAVSSPNKSKLVLTVRGFGGGPALTDPLRIKAKAGKTKKVSLPLSAAGREVLQGCGADGLMLTSKS